MLERGCKEWEVGAADPKIEAIEPKRAEAEIEPGIEPPVVSVVSNTSVCAVSEHCC